MADRPASQHRRGEISAEEREREREEESLVREDEMAGKFNYLVGRSAARPNLLSRRDRFVVVVVTGDGGGQDRRAMQS